MPDHEEDGTLGLDERARRLLHDRLDEVLGHEAADVLIRELATMRDDQLATKGDVTRLGDELRREITALRTATAAELVAVRNELSTEAAALRSEMRLGFAEARTEREALRADLHERLNDVQAQSHTQFRQLLYANLGTTLTVAAIAFGAASLG